MRFFSINYVIIILGLFFFSCVNKSNESVQKTSLKNISSEDCGKFISAYFIQKGTTFPVRMGCLSTDDDGKPSEKMFYIKNSEKKFMDEFTKIYNQLSISKEQIDDIDVRIKIFVHINNKKIDTLCLGEFRGLMKNGTKMNDSEEFLNLIKGGIKYETTFKDPFEEYRKKK